MPNSLRAPIAGLLLIAAMQVAWSCRRVTIVAATTTSAHRYGPLMVDTGRRFELLGRAIVGSQWEFAGYQLEEIEETFHDDLPHAAPPHDVDAASLRSAAAAFASAALPGLRAALTARDAARARGAFGAAARRCNDCHESHGHGFIEVPVEPGHPVPRVGAPGVGASTSTATGVDVPAGVTDAGP